MTLHIFISAFWIAGFVLALMPVPALETVFFAGSIACVTLSLLGSLYSVYKNGTVLKCTRLILTGAFFWAVAFNSVIWSEVRFESYLYFWFLSALPLSFLIFSLPREKHDLFVISGVGAGVVISLLALINLYFVFLAPEWLHHGQAGWPFADPNALAGLLSLGVFAAAGLMLHTGHAGVKKILLFGGLFLLAVLIMTGSRAAVLALLPAFLIFVLFARHHFKRHVLCVGLSLAGILVVFAASWVLSSDGGLSPAASLSITPDALDVRPAMWASAWEIIKAHFWTGTGIGTFYLYYPEVRGADTGTAGIHAHNDPLEFFSDMGIAAPLLFYAFIVLAVMRTLKALRQLSQDDKLRIAILVPFCALAAMIAHTHVEFNFYVLPTLMASGLLLAYWFYVTERALNNARVISYWPKPALGFAGLMLVLGAAAFLSAAASSILVQKAQVAADQGDLEGFGRAVNLAGKLAHQQNAQAYLLASRIPLGMIEHGMGNDALSQQAESLLIRAGTLNPRSVAILVERARLKELQNDLTGSVSLLQQAVVINPLYLPARVRLAEQLRAVGNDKEAFVVLKAGLRWPYYGAEAVTYFEQAAASAAVFGDTETAALAAEMKARHEGRMGLMGKRKVFSTDM